MPLVLARKPQQSVVITTPEGRTIVVRNFGHFGKNTKLLFEADHDVKIDREEVLEREEVEVI